MPLPRRCRHPPAAAVPPRLVLLVAAAHRGTAPAARAAAPRPGAPRSRRRRRSQGGQHGLPQHHVGNIAIYRRLTPAAHGSTMRAARNVGRRARTRKPWLRERTSRGVESLQIIYIYRLRRRANVIRLS
jgi:hypothetical protein